MPFCSGLGSPRALADEGAVAYGSMRAITRNMSLQWTHAAARHSPLSRKPLEDPQHSRVKTRNRAAD